MGMFLTCSTCDTTLPKPSRLKRQCAECSRKARDKRVAEGRGYTECYRCNAGLSGMYGMPRLCKKCDLLRIAAMPTEKRKARVHKGNERMRQRKAADPEFRRQFNAKAAAKRYGLTLEEYEELLLKPCAICGATLSGKERVTRLCVDHDHASGKVRDVLCMSCNMGLGKFHDDPVLLKRALAYVRRHSMLGIRG